MQNSSHIKVNQAALRSLSEDLVKMGLLKQRKVYFRS